MSRNDAAVYHRLSHCISIRGVFVYEILVYGKIHRFNSGYYEDSEIAEAKSNKIPYVTLLDLNLYGQWDLKKSDRLYFF
jgi:hypothetical protein